MVWFLCYFHLHKKEYYDYEDDVTSNTNNSKSLHRASAVNVTAAGDSSGSGGGSTGAAIYVVVRKRPMAKTESRKKEADVIRRSNAGTLHVNEPKVKVDLTKYVERHEFMFDEVFDESHHTADIYNSMAKAMVSSIFQGRKATCFAYGQTGR